MRFLGPKSCKFKFSWPLAKSGCLFSEVFGTIILQIQIFLASGQEWMPVSRGFLDQHLDLYLPPCWNSKGATFLGWQRCTGGFYGGASRTILGPRCTYFFTRKPILDVFLQTNQLAKSQSLFSAVSGSKNVLFMYHHDEMTKWQLF